MSWKGEEATFGKCGSNSELRCFASELRCLALASGAGILKVAAGSITAPAVLRPCGASAVPTTQTQLKAQTNLDGVLQNDQSCHTPHSKTPCDTVEVVDTVQSWVAVAVLCGRGPQSRVAVVGCGRDLGSQSQDKCGEHLGHTGG
jgi:hypothetical protein